MAIVKISELIELTTPADGDQLIINDISEPVDIDKTKRITVVNFLANVLAVAQSYIYRRQGGSSTIWNTAGSTNYTPTAGTSKIQVGANEITTNSGGQGSVTVTFPVAFTYSPLVLVTMQKIGLTDNNNYSVWVKTISNSAVAIQIFGIGAIETYQVNWIAIGE